MDNNDEDRIKTRRRPWSQWPLWAFWLFLEIIFLQSAVASHQEFEPRAAAIYWMMFGLLLLGGIVAWLVRQIQSM